MIDRLIFCLGIVFGANDCPAFSGSLLKMLLISFFSIQVVFSDSQITLAQSTVSWTGEFAVPSPTRGAAPWNALLKLDTSIIEAGRPELPHVAKGTATVSVYDPDKPAKKYQMSSPIDGSILPDFERPSAMVSFQMEFDVRTADAEIAAMWAQVSGPAWNEAARIQVVLTGDLIETIDGNFATHMVGKGNVNLADFGCIVAKGIQEMGSGNMSTLPNRCGRQKNELVWRVDADTSCALSPVKPAEIAKHFQAMMPAINHPRCQNCHGALNVFAEDTLHSGGDQREFEEVEDPFTGDTVKEEAILDQSTLCQDCHDLAEGHWRQLRTEEVQWAGRSARSICQTWVKQDRNMQSAATIVEHISKDVLIQQAFIGMRGISDLSPFDVESEEALPIPGFDHQIFVELSKRWYEAARIGSPLANACACQALPD